VCDENGNQHPRRTTQAGGTRPHSDAFRRPRPNADHRSLCREQIARAHRERHLPVERHRPQHRVYRHLDELEELGVITAVDAGPNNRYTLNDDSEIATRLWELEGLTLQRLLDIEDSDE